MDGANLSKKRWSYLKKGDVVWAKLNKQVWPAVVAIPCTTDNKIEVHWLASKERSAIAPNPTQLEKYLGKDPSPTLQPLKTSDQKRTWKILQARSTFKAAVSKAQELIKEQLVTPPVATLRVGHKLSYYAPHQNHSLDSILSCIILRVMDAASIQRDCPLETNAIHRFSVDDEVFFEGLPSTPLSHFEFEEGVSKECKSNSVVESVMRHRKALAEKVPSSMSDLLLEPTEQKGSKRLGFEGGSSSRRKRPTTSSCCSDDEVSASLSSTRGRSASPASGPRDEPSDSDTDVRSCRSFHEQPKRKDRKIKNISCKSDDETMPSEQIDDTVIGKDNSLASSQEDDVIGTRIIHSVLDCLRKAEAELGDSRVQLLESLEATRSFFLEDLSRRGIDAI